MPSLLIEPNICNEHSYTKIVFKFFLSSFRKEIYFQIIYGCTWALPMTTLTHPYFLIVVYESEIWDWAISDLSTIDAFYYYYYYRRVSKAVERNARNILMEY